ncbi:hypothetical protein IZY60_05915 [Lutibacter sp. B2]|nr:hypothetical protein [Lutibacter sp. B2]
MSIRPVDFQMLVSKTQQLSQEKQMQNYKVKTEYDQIIENDKKNVDHELKKVNKSENKDEAHIRDDQRKKNKHKNNKSKKENEYEGVDGHKTKLERTINSVGNKIDIKI